jgi:hypothetical protein
LQFSLLLPDALRPSALARKYFLLLKEGKGASFEHPQEEKQSHAKALRRKADN